MTQMRARRRRRPQRAIDILGRERGGDWLGTAGTVCEEHLLPGTGVGDRDPPSETASAVSDGVNIIWWAGVNQVITHSHMTCLSEVTSPAFRRLRDQIDVPAIALLELIHIYIIIKSGW